MTSRSLKKLKKGTRLRFKRSFRKFYKSISAWEWCSVGGTKMIAESQALDYFFHKAIELGLEDSVTFQFFRNDVGDKKPGATVTVTVGPYSDDRIVSVDDVELVK